VQIAGQYRVYHHRRACELCPVHFENADPARCCLLLDELQALHSHQRNENGSELLCDSDLLNLLRHDRGRMSAGDGRQDQHKRKY
jgi:hypothetical protein